MRVLYVLSSSNQMYSGIGRNVFELTARLMDRARFEFAIDDRNPKNLALVGRFCRQHSLPLHIGRGRSVPEALDDFNEDLPALLREYRWDAIEFVCWANAATNDAVLREAGDTVLIYTPHFQPTWTCPTTPSQAEFIERVHRLALQRADAILCVSPQERDELSAAVRGEGEYHYIANGCDFGAFRPGPPRRRPQLLFVGDLAEPRKRFDRVLAVFRRVLRARPEMRLVVVGNRSDSARDLIPPDLRHACDLRGYVEEAILRRAYAESQGLFLLSDFEAFGIPVLEALASGTPVFLSQQEATESLFGTYPGACFCNPDDPDATADMVLRVLALGQEVIAAVLAGRRRLQAAFDWEVLADRKWDALAAAWFRRRCWSWPAEAHHRTPEQRGTGILT
ncbi:MAG: glycosyltransferase family 4 protein [Isosphaeraceae bacterium]|nr:glycosyltransferase family 4 protein [Isosphaeraceae bacterium]